MTNRRRFLQLTGAAALTSGARFGLAAPIADRSFEYGRPLREFHYGQVAFAPGLHQIQLEQTHSILMNLNEESLLRPFRLRAGLPAPGCDLGGWYTYEGPTTFGQWLSALSRYYAITQDKATGAKVERLVNQFSQVVEPTGKLYGGDPSLAYLYDKLVCGLMDAKQFAQQQQALSVLGRATEAAKAHLPGKAIDFFTNMAGGETYTIPENQFIAWQRGGSQSHLDMATQYLHDGYFDPLARGENVLPGRHAYSHVNALSSAAKAYLVLGDERYLRAAQNGLALVEAQSFATGGWGPSEFFVPFAGLGQIGLPSLSSLHDSIERSHSHFETPCGAYAHFKLTRYLLRITKDARYGDSMERVMYNTVLGAKSLRADGRAFYYSDYNREGHKSYYDGGGGDETVEWPCCSGTLPQVAADYRISSYFSDPEGVYVNLYIPSTLTWKQGAAQIKLSQSGTYPLGDLTTLTIEASAPQDFALRLRIPGWAKQPSISVNGARLKSPIQTGTFASIKRQWRSGDRIELELPRQVELKSIDTEHPDTVAVVNGPLALFAIGDVTPSVTRPQLLAAVQTVRDGPEWRVETSSGKLHLVPFWVIDKERYSLYLSV